MRVGDFRDTLESLFAKVAALKKERDEYKNLMEGYRSDLKIALSESCSQCEELKEKLKIAEECLQSMANSTTQPGVIRFFATEAKEALAKIKGEK